MIFEFTDEKYLESNSFPVPESGCWLWEGAVNYRGYGVIDRIVEGVRRVIRVHRMSYETFIGAIPKGLIVRHSCDVFCCINPRHLLVGTHQANMDDMTKRSRQAYGYNVGPKVLVEEDVKEIRSLYATGNYTQERLSKMFNTARSNISYVVREVTWTKKKPY